VLVNRNGNVTINLPDATANSGRSIYIKKINQTSLSSVDVIIDPYQFQQIDGNSTYSFTDNYTYSGSPEHGGGGGLFYHYDYGILIISDGSNWWTIGEYD
jgi:hypothetical protein